MTQEKPWFVYQPAAGRITGRPASLRGWLVFAGILVAIPVLAVPAMGLLIHARHPILGALVLATILLGGLFLLLRVMLAKGRRIG